MAHINKNQFENYAAYYPSHECICQNCNTYFKFSFADIKSALVNGCYGGPYCFVTCPNCQSEVKDDKWKYIGIPDSN